MKEETEKKNIMESAELSDDELDGVSGGIRMSDVTRTMSDTTIAYTTTAIVNGQRIGVAAQLQTMEYNPAKIPKPTLDDGVQRGKPTGVMEC